MKSPTSPLFIRCAITLRFDCQLLLFYFGFQLSQYLIIPAIDYITSIPRPQHHTVNITDGKHTVFTKAFLTAEMEISAYSL